MQKMISQIARVHNKKIYFLCSGKSISIEDLVYKIFDVDRNQIKLEEKKYNQNLIGTLLLVTQR
jgi:hypothetical protein